MTLHLVKLCVGAEDVSDLQRWQDHVVRQRKAAHLSPFPTHETRQTPKRRDELLAGGSIFWVIKGVILVRQAIIDITTEDDRFGKPFCELHFDPVLVATEALPKRPFQGWRYLKSADAPRDATLGTTDVPPNLSQALKQAGVW